MSTSLFPGFRELNIDTAPGVSIHTIIGGAGAPLVLLHGHPQTLAIWHKVAPALCERFTVVACDLRGYGDSSRPDSDDTHFAYSKRAMATDVLRVMQSLGFPQFSVLAHDRGARVAHRLAVDFPDAVRRMVLLDIAPTLAMYTGTTEAFARLYWHWFFLIQPAPLPERLIMADPGAYIRDVMGGRNGSLAAFDQRALDEYARCLALPGAAHGLCEEYRAAATVDLEHDRGDLAHGRKMGVPTQVLWGERGVVHRCFKPLDEWRKVALNVSGHALPCGHYVPEEAPEALLAAALPFLDAR
jgi:haloacetate dehalogenase